MRVGGYDRYLSIQPLVGFPSQDLKGLLLIDIERVIMEFYRGG